MFSYNQLKKAGDRVWNYITGAVYPALGDYTGIDVMDFSEKYKNMNEAQSALVKYANALANTYMTFAETTGIETPANDLTALEAAVRQAQNASSDFSKFAAGYAPYSTAKRTAERKLKELADKAEKAEQIYDKGRAINEEINNSNTRMWAEVNAKNAANAAKVSAHNAAVDAASTQINNLVNRGDVLMNSSNLIKATPEFGKLTDDWLDQTNKLIEQKEEQPNEKTSKGNTKPITYN